MTETQENEVTILDKILNSRKKLASMSVDSGTESQIRDYLSKAYVLSSTNAYGAERQIQLAHNLMEGLNDR